MGTGTGACARGRFAAGAAALLLVAAAPPAAADLRFDTRVGVAALRGDATYAIGGAYAGPIGTGTANDPLSELVFPLDATLATLEVTVEAPLRRGRLVLDGRFSRTVTEGTGTLRDRDWTRRDRPELVTILSESEASLDAAIVDLRARWRLLEVGGDALGLQREQGRGWVSVGAGYLWQRLSFEARDVQQLGLRPGDAGSVAGRVADYEALYRIPYAELAAGVGLGTPAGVALSLEGRVGASPLARADDVDDHLLRAKRSEGDCSGTAVLAGVRARLGTGRFFVDGGVSAMTLDATGVQRQSRYEETDEGPAGFLAEIGQRITSSQTRFDLALGMAF